LKKAYRKKAIQVSGEIYPVTIVFAKIILDCEGAIDQKKLFGQVLGQEGPVVKMRICLGIRRIGSQPVTDERQYHPDKNPSPEAEAMFKNVG